ncbi:hypothetical protein [Roseivirga sp. UBA1976]|uniref:hypothetical protein n=1 Tax=Roseivirga sp. UBA1976 TaxID=1947386 RepID=UPI002580174A|nr:hypothetical protein [Roseivirga sp. UBA1976]|tara:strand:- start:4886 stop:5125 length:240 start_codon:yes stop_codon:yes gene_type:complete
MTKREVNRLISDLTDEIRMVTVNKRQFDKKLKDFDKTHFTGRIETNEIKIARKESQRLEGVLSELKKERSQYERIKKKL